MNRQLCIDDLFSIRWVRDPQMAPGGGYVAYVESWLDRPLDAELSAVLVVGLDGTVLLRLAEPGRRFTSPRWAPDGSRLGLLSDADGTMQVWLVDLGTGARSRLTDLSGTPVDLDWSPDGNDLAVTVEDLYELAGDPGYAVVDLPCHVDGSARPARKSSELFLVHCSERLSEKLELGAERAWHPRWAPEGHTLAFLQASSSVGQISNIWTMDLRHSSAPLRITDGTGPVRAFSWSPAGDQLAYVGHRDGEATDVNHALWRISPQDRAAVNLTGDLDRSVGVAVRSDDARGTSTVLAWSKASGRIYFEVAEGGRGPLRWVDPEGGSGAVFDTTCVALGPSASVSAARPCLAAVVTTAESPGDVFVLDELGGEPRRVSASNPWLSEVDLPETEQVYAEATDGAALEGWIVHQGSARLAAPSPLVVSVHGGPHYAVGWRFNFEHLRLAASGYAVLAANPRGSLGYGQRFASGIRGSWGGQDWLDLTAIIASARQQPHVDSARTAITGVSYGGFMTLWAITRTAEFRAAICENGISNLLSAWGTSQDAGVTIETELGGSPWTSTERYVERSPICHADAIWTPLLLVHAEADRNCPIEQSEQMYVALRRLGRETGLVRLTGEGHLVNLVGRPSRRLFRATVVDAWLARHLAEPACHETS